MMMKLSALVIMSLQPTNGFGTDGAWVAMCREHRAMGGWLGRIPRSAVQRHCACPDRVYSWVGWQLGSRLRLMSGLRAWVRAMSLGQSCSDADGMGGSKRQTAGRLSNQAWVTGNSLQNIKTSHRLVMPYFIGQSCSDANRIGGSK